MVFIIHLRHSILYICLWIDMMNDSLVGQKGWTNFDDDDDSSCQHRRWYYSIDFRGATSIWNEVEYFWVHSYIVSYTLQLCLRQPQGMSYRRTRMKLHLFFAFWLIPIVLLDQRDDRSTISGLHLRVAVAQVLNMIILKN